MNVTTQISGNILPGNSVLHALKSALSRIGINVTHPSRNESLFYETDSFAAWHHYDNEVVFYNSIANSPFHIVYNDGEINEEIGLQASYAMLKNRPILMTGTSTLSQDLSPFIREIITKHIHRFHSINLSEFELTELSLLIDKLKPVDYSLSKQEKILLNARIKSHFRNLLQDSKELRLARSRSLIQPIEEN